MLIYPYRVAFLRYRLSLDLARDRRRAPLLMGHPPTLTCLPAEATEGQACEYMFFRKKKNKFKISGVFLIVLLGLFVWGASLSPNDIVLFNYPATADTEILDKNLSLQQFFLPYNPDRIIPLVQAEEFIDNQVPFTPQAPLAEWHDSRQQDGCEEASVLMAIAWSRGEKLTPSIARAEILAISDWELNKYQSYVDTSAADTLKRIVLGYFGHQNAEVKSDISLSDIVSEINKGRVVLVPADGRKLGNPYFTPPGPERHMLLIRGYDLKTREFITNDPGTKRGEAYRYKEDVLFNAILDYPTGDHIPITEEKKAMIAVWK